MIIYVIEIDCEDWRELGPAFIDYEKAVKFKEDMGEFSIYAGIREVELFG